MPSRIEHWQRKYRVHGPAVPGRLDALAAGRVLEVYEDDLRRAFGDGPDLILVRQVDLRLGASLAASGETALARKWGEAMAAAVVRAVTNDPGQGDVVRYPDVCAHLADFLDEVADGRPANQWYFARFADHRRRSPSETIAEALLARPRCLPSVLRRLSQSGGLSRVLAWLDEPMARQLWAEGVAGISATPEAERPLFAVALTLLAELGGPAVGQSQAESWFADFLASASAPTDWRDRTHLAQTVLAAARFLLARNPTKRPPAALVAAVVARLDWLDNDWLRMQLPSLWGEPATTSPSPSPLSRRAGPTPRQGQWLEALRRVLPRLATELDRADLGAPKNLLRALGALTEAHPVWTEDPALAVFVESIFRAAAELVRTARADRVTSAPSGNGLCSAITSIRHLGEPGAAVVRELAALAAPSTLAGSDHHAAFAALSPTPQPTGLAESVPTWVTTDLAGALLLLRAFQDLRLGMLARRCEFPASGSEGPRWLFVALAARLAGLESVTDPGLQLLCPESTDFLTVWGGEAQSAESFQQALAQTLAGHRLVGEPDSFTSASVTTSTGHLRLTGDASSQLWPFAVPVESAEAAESLPFIEALAGGTVGDAWADATLLVTAQALLRAWARWLKQLGGSSTPYLLTHFIRRPGQIALDGATLTVELEPRPLDVVLQLSGYLDPIELLTDWPFHLVRFHVGRAG